jgi:metal-dependent amidase/aminoacylase/carboxypeptidase family protein
LDLRALAEDGAALGRAETGALATGCELEVEPESKPYADFRTSSVALEAYGANALALGRELDGDPMAKRMNRASTDMGNVSQVVPAMHPYTGLGCFPVLNHQKEFADHCVGEAAERALLDRGHGDGLDRARRHPITLKLESWLIFRSRL